MAKRSKKEAGNDFLEGVLKHLSKEDADAVRASLAKSDAALEAVGEGAWRQEDYSRVMDEGRAAIQAKATEYDQELNKVRAHDGELNQWYEANNAALANGTAALRRLEELKQKGIDVDFKPPVEGKIVSPAADGDFVKKTELVNAVSQAYGLSVTQGMQYLNALQNIGFKHQQTFKEPLDVIGLDKHCRETRAPSLEAGYQTFMKDRLETRAAEEKKSEEDRIRKEERQKFAQELAARGGMPYIPSDEGGNASLAALKTGTGGENALAAAVSEFNQRQMGRWSGNA